MRKTAAQADRILREIARDLEQPDKLEAEYARLLVEQAQQNASSRPTPQSALAADSLSLSGNRIRTAAGIPSEVGASSEYGSDIYPQFQHTHTIGGLWLHPAAEDTEVLKQTDAALNELVEDAI